MPKACSPMLVTLSGIVTDVRELQYSNALLPMLVTLSGIVTDVRALQPSKAKFPMLVTPFWPPAFWTRTHTAIFR